MFDLALEVVALTKTYGDFRAVDAISFNVPCGGVIGLLGPNGAGKTTTIQMLLGTTEPTSGTIRCLGEDFRKNRLACLQRINFTSAYNELQGRITVRENLMVFAGLYSVRNAKAKVAELGEYFELGELMNQRFATLSAGQRTRVNIAKALLNDPELVLMDEPTASLDPDIREKVMTLIERTRKERELSILFTSHNMDEVTRICDRVIFLDHGKILRQETPERLAAEVGTPQVFITFQGDALSVLSHLGARYGHATAEGANRVAVAVGASAIPAMLAGLTELKNVNVTDIDIRKPTLEDAFLHFSRGNGSQGSGNRSNGVTNEN